MLGQIIGCEDAKAVVENGGQIIDVRTPMEYQQFAIPGAINIPLQNLMNEVSQLDPEKPTILYCRTGARSGHAQMLLNQLGFKETYNLGSVNNYFSCD